MSECFPRGPARTLSVNLLQSRINYHLTFPAHCCQQTLPNPYIERLQTWAGENSDEVGRLQGRDTDRPCHTPRPRGVRRAGFPPERTGERCVTLRAFAPLFLLMLWFQEERDPSKWLWILHLPPKEWAFGWVFKGEAEELGDNSLSLSFLCAGQYISAYPAWEQDRLININKILCSDNIAAVANFLVTLTEPLIVIMSVANK